MNVIVLIAVIGAQKLNSSITSKSATLIKNSTSISISNVPRQLFDFFNPHSNLTLRILTMFLKLLKAYCGEKLLLVHQLLRVNHATIMIQVPAQQSRKMMIGVMIIGQQFISTH